jgi:serine/threonine protein kinase/tetratricopeptide (TPR) repeat protein
MVNSASNEGQSRRATTRRRGAGYAARFDLRTRSLVRKAAAVISRTLDTGQDGDVLPGTGPSHHAVSDIVGAYRVVGELGRGGMGVVYHAVHTSSGQRVAIKMVNDCNRALLAALRAEVTALQHVKHPYIVSVLDEGLSETVPWYAMDFVDGLTLASFNENLWRDVPFSSDGQGPEETLSRAPRAVAAGKLTDVLQSYCKLCDALMHVHAQGIVHRDLKPANVMLRPDATPVLMDFGIASRAFGKAGRDQLDLTMGFLGSALYAAPEQIRGEAVDARADLYSLGCMLYETLTGRPPFVAGGARQILNKHLHEDPTPASRVVPGVPFELDRLLLSLLNKSPRERIGHADDVMAVLLASSPWERPEGVRFVPSPQPHLYRPTVAGRELLVAQICEHLDAARQGRGRAVFFEGESGIGKTFLATEAARQAGLQSVQVVTGACLSVSTADGGEALHSGQLHAFRGLLQTVADRCREGSQAFIGGSLKDAITILSVYEPSLEPFSYGSTQHLRALPPEAVRLRVIGALAEVLNACAIETPLLLILDDLHWGDELSLNFLESLPEGYFEDKPILLFGLCRPEEAGKSLRAIMRRGDVSLLRLNRLSHEAILSMTSDMLAMAEPPDPFIRFLVRRSEGNPFFAAEYLRLFAEERILRREGGAWVFGKELETSDDAPYERLDLPVSVKEIVARRLRHLRAEDRIVIEAASVIGREFDVDLLSVIVSQEPSSLEGSLRELATKGIIGEVAAGQYRFEHDHLRAVAYGQIPLERRRTLHGATGLALETRPGGQGANRAAELAYHYKEARERAKALAHLEKAAAHAVATFANREAARLFHDLLELSAVETGPDAMLRRARWERGLGDALHGEGQHDLSRAHLESALRLLGHAPPSSGKKLAAATVAQLLEQAGRRILPRRVGKAPAGETTRDQEAAQAYDRLLQIFYYTGAQVEMLHATLKTLNLSERGGPSPELARAYAIAHAVSGIIPLRALAETYLEGATRILHEAPDPDVESYLLLLTGGYRAGIAAWELSRFAFDRGLKIATGLSFHRRCDEIRLGLGNWNFLRGRFDEASLEADTQLMSSRRGDPQAHAWRVLVRAQALLALGSVDHAAKLARDAKTLLPDLQRSERMWTFAVLASTAYRRGEFDEALSYAAQTLDQILAGPPGTFYCVEAYSSVCDVYLSLWERCARLGLAAGDLPDRAKSACKALRSFARVFPAARPRSDLRDGTLHHLSGRKAQAEARWKRSLQIATDLRMPYDEAVAGWTLGRATVRGNPERQQRLARALRDASALGAVSLAERARKDMETG